MLEVLLACTCESVCLTWSLYGILRESISTPQAGDVKHQQYQGLQQGGIACGKSCLDGKGRIWQTEQYPFPVCLGWGRRAQRA